MSDIRIDGPDGGRVVSVEGNFALVAPQDGIWQQCGEHDLEFRFDETGHPVSIRCSCGESWVVSSASQDK